MGGCARVPRKWSLMCSSAVATAYETGFFVDCSTQVALPFGTFDAVLADPLNAVVKASLEAMYSSMDVAQLPAARELIRSLQVK